MRAITVINPGPAYRLAACDIDPPAPGPGQVLLAIAAAGVNRADLLQASGKYPPPPGASEILGLEVAGEVVEAGAGCTLKPGAHVCALLTGGGYGAFALADEGCCLPVPHGVVLREAAALPEALFTVWSNLVDTAELKPGETVLIHGGASGIGTMAIQLALSMGARVLTTAGGPERCARCETLGAERAIDHYTEDFVSAVMRATDARGADVILDMVGGDYVSRNFEAAATGGRIVNIAFQKGAATTVNFVPMIQKRLTMAATTLRPRPGAEKQAIRDALAESVWPLIETAAILPVIDTSFALEDAQAAHDHMRSGKHFGKILLTV